MRRTARLCFAVVAVLAVIGVQHFGERPALAETANSILANKKPSPFAEPNFVGRAWTSGISAPRRIIPGSASRRATTTNAANPGPT